MRNRQRHFACFFVADAESHLGKISCLKSTGCQPGLIERCISGDGEPAFKIGNVGVTDIVKDAVIGDHFSPDRIIPFSSSEEHQSSAVFGFDDALIIQSVDLDRQQLAFAGNQNGSVVFHCSGQPQTVFDLATGISTIDIAYQQGFRADVDLSGNIDPAGLADEGQGVADGVFTLCNIAEGDGADFNGIIEVECQIRTVGHFQGTDITGMFKGIFRTRGKNEFSVGKIGAGKIQSGIFTIKFQRTGNGNAVSNGNSIIQNGSTSDIHLFQFKSGIDSQGGIFTDLEQTGNRSPIADGCSGTSFTHIKIADFCFSIQSSRTAPENDLFPVAAGNGE